MRFRWSIVGGRVRGWARKAWRSGREKEVMPREVEGGSKGEAENDCGGRETVG